MENRILAIADSLGWALLHSIWQITLIATLVSITLALTNRDNAKLRFIISFAGMVGSLTAFAITFAVYFVGFLDPPSVAGANATANGGFAGYVETIGQMTWLVSLCWGIGFTILGARYARALRATHRLRHVGINYVPEEWELRFRLWVERLGADARTLVRYSDAVSTPVTIGMLKPLVLVPTGFFLRMPQEQAEAILVHEIAHVCRQDYLLGLIQAIIHTVFFFHPAMHFLSRQIDVEREHACDNWAALETGNGTALACGLSQIALESQTPPPGFALAADGQRTPLMDRINRLANRPIRQRTSSGTPLAILGIAFSGSLMIAIGAEASSGMAPADDSHVLAYSAQSKGNHTIGFRDRPATPPFTPATPAPAVPPAPVSTPAAPSAPAVLNIEPAQTPVRPRTRNIETHRSTTSMGHRDIARSRQVTGNGHSETISISWSTTAIDGKTPDEDCEDHNERIAERRGDLQVRFITMVERRRARVQERIERQRERAEAQAERYHSRIIAATERDTEKMESLVGEPRQIPAQIVRLRSGGDHDQASLLDSLQIVHPVAEINARLLRWTIFEGDSDS